MADGMDGWMVTLQIPGVWLRGSAQPVDVALPRNVPLHGMFNAVQLHPSSLSAARPGLVFRMDGPPALGQEDKSQPAHRVSLPDRFSGFAADHQVQHRGPAFSRSLFSDSLPSADIVDLCPT
jgi:hypothetical protein